MSPRAALARLFPVHGAAAPRPDDPVMAYPARTAAKLGWVTPADAEAAPAATANVSRAAAAAVVNARKCSRVIVLHFCVRWPGWRGGLLVIPGCEVVVMTGPFLKTIGT